jgi:hypothetical protein
MSLPRTARAALKDYYYCVIDRGNGHTVVFLIERLDERITTLVGLDANLRPIGRPQTLVEM